MTASKNLATTFILQMDDGVIEAPLRYVNYSLTLRKMIYDLENVEPKIKIPKLNQEIVGYIFNYIGRYYVRDAKSKKNSDYEWAKSFFNEAASKPFLDNFGNILMASQFLQVEILTSMMERYIYDTISACKTAEEVGKALSLELEGSVPERLQWTERLEK